MAYTFEEVTETEAAQQAEEVPQQQEIKELLRPLAIAAGVVYIAATAFGPFILLGEAITRIPKYFGALFIIATIVYIAAFVGWIVLNKKVGAEQELKKLWWPLLAIPTSIILFYVLAGVLLLINR